MPPCQDFYVSKNTSIFNTYSYTHLHVIENTYISVKIPTFSLFLTPTHTPTQASTVHLLFFPRLSLHAPTLSLAQTHSHIHARHTCLFPNKRLSLHTLLATYALTHVFVSTSRTDRACHMACYTLIRHVPCEYVLSHVNEAHHIECSASGHSTKGDVTHSYVA